MSRMSNRLTRSQADRLTILAASLLLSACVDSTVQQVKRPGANINSADSVVILTRGDDSASETEANFVDCVERRLSEQSNHLHVEPHKSFVDALFPWFEPGTAPANIDSLPRLLANPGVRNGIDHTGVRYLVWLGGSTERVDSGGAMGCTASPAGAGCLGFGWWEDSADYEATIWDLQTGSTSGMVSADASGTSYMPALIIPIPLIARTQAAACKGLATQLAKFLGGVPEQTGSE